jgi:diadenosine tetraphosphate (Ap4A) HIT family hydrolase
MVLVSSENASAFSELSREAFAELQSITREIETGLRRAFAYDKINYLMLMMVDPDVHFHVIPRYAESKVMADCTFHDYGWPGPPALSRVNETSKEQNQQIIQHVKVMWD